MLNSLLYVRETQIMTLEGERFTLPFAAGRRQPRGMQRGAHESRRYPIPWPSLGRRRLRWQQHEEEEAARRGVTGSAVGVSRRSAPGSAGSQLKQKEKPKQKQMKHRQEAKQRQKERNTKHEQKDMKHLPPSLALLLERGGTRPGYDHDRDDSS